MQGVLLEDISDNKEDKDIFADIEKKDIDLESDSSENKNREEELMAPKSTKKVAAPKFSKNSVVDNSEELSQEVKHLVVSADKPVPMFSIL